MGWWVPGGSGGGGGGDPSPELGQLVQQAKEYRNEARAAATEASETADSITDALDNYPTKDEVQPLIVEQVTIALGDKLDTKANIENGLYEAEVLSTDLIDGFYLTGEKD